MDNNLRILIADRNRFHALILEREIHKKFPSCVTAVFRSASDTLRELRHSRYDAAIVDCTIAFEDEINLFKVIQRENRVIPILLTSVPGAVCPPTALCKDGLVKHLTKEGAFHVLAPELIEHVLREGIFHHGRPQQMPRLSLRRKADMINITTSTLAHEINNPLMSILGMSELLLGNGVPYDSDVRSKIEAIQESARRIEAVLENLTHLSRPILKPTATGNMIDTGSAKAPPA